jgi:hypothetical protein
MFLASPAVAQAMRMPCARAARAKSRKPAISVNDGAKSSR